MFVLAPALPSEAGWGTRTKVRPSGRTVEKTLDLSDFERIEIRTVVDLEIRQGEEYQVEVEIDEALEELLDARVSGNKLRIGLDEDVNWDGDEGIRLWITMPTLESLEVKGVADVTGRQLELEELEIVVSGVANIELAGTAQVLDLEFSGVGDVDLRDLEAMDADVRISGVGKARVRVKGELVASVSGLGNLRYYGDPQKVRPKVSGMGSIEAAD
jgi:hypothetical protein